MKDNKYEPQSACSHHEQTDQQPKQLLNDQLEQAQQAKQTQRATDTQYKDASIRTQWLIGKDALSRLKHSTVAIFGLGGVGSYAAEALCRSGVGHLILFDHDKIAPSNLNRQLIATHDTMDQKKVDAAKNRLLSINPACIITTHALFWTADITVDDSYTWLPDSVDYIIDAIDTVSAKINLVCLAKTRHVPVISCMGTGNKLDPGKLRLTDIYKTSTCPLARVMRRELKKRQITDLKVVYSEEKPRKPLRDVEDSQKDMETSQTGMAASQTGTETSQTGYVKQGPASIAFVPGSAGLMLAAAVVNDLIADCLPET